MELQEIENKIEAFEGDKRTKEYKELVERRNALLESVKNPEGSNLIDVKPQMDSEENEFLNRVSNFRGVIRSKDLDWFYKGYNKLFNTELKPCKCPGQIRIMVNKVRRYKDGQNKKK